MRPLRHCSRLCVFVPLAHLRKTIITRSGKRKSDRFISRHPAAPIFRTSSTARWRCCTPSSTSRRGRRSPRLRRTIRSARWRSGAWPCRIITACGTTAIRRPGVWPKKAQQIAAGNAKTTAREQAYIDALAEIYREDGKDAHAHGQPLSRRWGRCRRRIREDDEAAIFHALSLAITAPKTDKTFANQRKCGEILEPIFAKQPHHPGMAHYIIHCYDNPVLAEQGLKAARMYAKIAPASAHANHMPSHLFTRVGSWDESISLEPEVGGTGGGGGGNVEEWRGAGSAAARHGLSRVCVLAERTREQSQSCGG